MNDCSAESGEHDALQNHAETDRPQTQITIRVDTTLVVEDAAGSVLAVKITKATALLGLLALAQGHMLQRAIVAPLLWSRLSERDAKARLNSLLSRLRQEAPGLIGGVICVHADRLEINTQNVLISLRTIGFSDDVYAPPSKRQLLSDLEGIDPAFDLWLQGVRKSLLYAKLEGSSPGEPRARITLNAPRKRGPRVLVSGFVSHPLATASQAPSYLANSVAIALSRFRWIDVVLDSPRSFNEASYNEFNSAEPDYVLCGLLSEAPPPGRIGVKLISARNAKRIDWVETFTVAVPLDVTSSDEIADKIAARLDPELMLLEASEAQTSSQAEEPYRKVMSAVRIIYRLERHGYLAARRILEQVISAEPDYPAAYTWLACWHVFHVGQGWCPDIRNSLSQASTAADRAILLDIRDARALTIAGHVKAFLCRDLEQAAELHERAIVVNPALPLAWHYLGMTRIYSGDIPGAEKYIQKSLALGPADPQGFLSEHGLAVVHLLKGDFAAAAAAANRVMRQHPTFTAALKTLLAALGHMQDLGRAKTVLERLRLLEPSFSLNRFRVTAPYQRRQDLELIVRGLRKGGAS